MYSRHQIRASVNLTTETAGRDAQLLPLDALFFTKHLGSFCKIFSSGNSPRAEFFSTQQGLQMDVCSAIRVGCAPLSRRGAAPAFERPDEGARTRIPKRRSDITDTQ